MEIVEAICLLGMSLGVIILELMVIILLGMYFIDKIRERKNRKGEK